MPVDHPAPLTADEDPGTAKLFNALMSLSVPPSNIDELRSLSRGALSSASIDLIGLNESLAAMEFCIYLEIECGLSVVPEDLIDLHCIGDVLDLINRS